MKHLKHADHALCNRNYRKVQFVEAVNECDCYSCAYKFLFENWFTKAKLKETWSASSLKMLGEPDKILKLKYEEAHFYSPETIQKIETHPDFKLKKKRVLSSLAQQEKLDKITKKERENQQRKEAILNAFATTIDNLELKPKPIFIQQTLANYRDSKDYFLTERGRLDDYPCLTSYPFDSLDLGTQERLMCNYVRHCLIPYDEVLEEDKYLFVFSEVGETINELKQFCNQKISEKLHSLGYL